MCFYTGQNGLEWTAGADALAQADNVQSDAWGVGNADVWKEGGAAPSSCP